MKTIPIRYSWTGTVLPNEVVEFNISLAGVQEKASDIMRRGRFDVCPSGSSVNSDDVITSIDYWIDLRGKRKMEFVLNSGVKLILMEYGYERNMRRRVG